jgi:hypothetical protein
MQAAVEVVVLPQQVQAALVAEVLEAQQVLEQTVHLILVEVAAQPLVLAHQAMAAQVM